MSGIDEAAAAFENDLATETGSVPNGGERTIPVESVFGNLNYDGADDEDGILEEAGQPHEAPARQAKVNGESSEAPTKVVDPFYGDDDAPDGGDEEIDPAKKAEDEEDDEEADGEPKKVAQGELDMDLEVEVMVDGEPTTLKLGEALQGAIRNETFQRRLSKLSEFNTALKAEAGSVIEQRQEYTTKITELVDMTEALVNKRPTTEEWDKMFREEPAAARKLQAEYETYDKTIAGLKTERERVAKEQEEHLTKERHNWLLNEFNRFQSHPDFRGEEGPKRLQKAITNMRGYAEEIGFSEAEVAGVGDSRMLRVLLDAAKYHALQKTKPIALAKVRQQGKPNANVPVTAKRSQSAPVAKNGAKARQRLARSGSIGDAASVFESIL